MPEQKRSALPDGHATLVLDKFAIGRIVPFLGAGVNLCDRPPNFQWSSSDPNSLPSGNELAQDLARDFNYLTSAKVCKGPAELCLRPHPELDLARISQYGDLTQGSGALYEKLRSIFLREPPATSVHRFLSALPPAEPEEKRPENRNLLIVTTNYDDLMEQALESYGTCDVVFYDPEGRPARFWHKMPRGDTNKIIDPESYVYPFFDERPVVLKIHGSIDRSDPERDGFVITEDHYIEYLAEEPIEKLLPQEFLTKLRRNHLLFLGYSLRDWNLRVFYRHLKRSPKQSYKGWAVMPSADRVEEQFWQRQDVTVVPVTLQTYIEALNQELASRRPALFGAQGGATVGG